MHSRLALVVLASLSFLLAPAQITNIEKLRKWTGERKMDLKTGLNFSYTNNDGAYIFNIGANAGVLYKFKDGTNKLNNKLFFIANYSLNRSEGQDFSNNWFLHLRFNKELNKTFRVESFLQTQRNQILSISSRSLIGAGIRLKIIEKLVGKLDKRSLHLYVGTAYMYEIEHSNAFNLDFYNHRSSSYLTASFDFGRDKLKLINTVYYQPLFEDFQNFRLAEEFSAEIPISDTLSFETSFTYFLNNLTPAGDAEFSSFVGLGLTYNFKSKLLTNPYKGLSPLW